MKSNLIKASSLALIALMACNKQKVNPSSGNQTSITESKGVEVNQKMYNLSPTQIKSSISFLTATDKADQTDTKDPNSNSNLLPDHSIWVLETALNYHFDRNPKNHEVSSESVEFSAPLTLQSGGSGVSTSDMKNVYDQFKASIAQLTSDSKKVKVIDITAIIQGGKITYKGSVVLFTNKNPIPSDCLPLSISAAWSTPYMGTGFCCPATTLPHGPTVVANKLNNDCPAFDPGCPGGGPFGWYWVNVSNSQWFDGYNSNTPSTWFPSSTGKLFYTFKTSQLNVCNGICIGLSAGFLNQYVAGCKTLAGSTIPTGCYAINYNLVDYWNPINSGVWQEGGWRMQCTYAYPVCNIPEG